jgi:hypothetical protein
MPQGKCKTLIWQTAINVSNVDGHFGNDRMLVKQIEDFFQTTFFRQKNFPLDKQLLCLKSSTSQFVFKKNSKS